MTGIRKIVTGVVIEKVATGVIVTGVSEVEVTAEGVMVQVVIVQAVMVQIGHGVTDQNETGLNAVIVHREESVNHVTPHSMKACSAIVLKLGTTMK